MADLYGYTMDYTLYRLSFSQCINLIDTRNERERKAQEAAEEKAQREDPNYVDMDKFKIKDDTPVEDLPTLSDLRAVFGSMMR